MKSDATNNALITSLLEKTANINTLEEACLLFARELFKALIQKIDDDLLKNRPEGLVCVGKRSRTISTMIGEIRITRRLYRRATKGKKSQHHFLLDEVLNIQPRRRVTHSLLKLIVSLSTRLPFREVTQVLEEAGFPSVSHATVHTEVRRYGKLQKQQLEQKRDVMFITGQEVAAVDGKKKVPFLFIEADGLMVGLQQSISKNQEIKLGVAYEGWEYQGKQRKLKNPTVIMGAFQGGDEFWETFSANLSQMYDLDNTLVIINGDGASWIQKTAKEYFAGAVIQLDRFHLIRDLRLLLGNVRAHEFMSVLRRGEVQLFLDTLESLEPSIKGNKVNLYRKLTNFCQKYPQHLLDYREQLSEQQKEGYKLFGMGVAETMVDKKLANRMKKRGMRWSRDGAWSMAALLMLRSNGRLFEWLDENSWDDIKNPVKQLSRQRTKVMLSGLKQEPVWRSVAIPSLTSATRPFITALRGLCGLYRV